MNITVLSENTTCRDDILSEHGLSLFVRTDNHKFLFDMGHSDNFAKNAEKLNIDIKSAEFAVLSHGHYDHGDGLGKFMELNNNANIYMSQYAYEPHYHEREKYIGLDKSLEHSKQYKFVSQNVTINEESQIMLLNENDLTEPIRPYGLHAIREGQFIDEDFRHEIYLTVNQNGKRIIFSGCSHKGIINITEYFKPDILIGGFHFMELSPETSEGRKELNEYAEKLKQYKTKFYTCHCTGVDNYKYIKNILGEQVEYISAGMEIKI